MMDSAISANERSCRFVSNDVPERERVAVTRDILSRGIWGFDFEPAVDVPFFSEGCTATLPGLVLADVVTSEGRTQRGPRHLVGDQYLLSICVSGTSRVSQCGRELTIRDGDAVLSMGAERATMNFTASRFLSLRLPAAALESLLPDAEDCVARRIDRDTPALKLLVGYAGILRETHALAGSAGQAAVAHVYDLAALALGAVGEDAAQSKRRALRAVRLRAIKADIEENLRAEGLSVEALATRHHLPVRYVRRLFEEDGTTFTAFVLEHRLARARQMLTNPRLAHQKISFVAIESGFSNLSYFNETFRRRFGLTPSEMRVQRQH
jgi:AraC-like DNA-binding protein